MSKKQWMVLLMLFLTYLLLGAFIFYHIESRLEIERVQEAKQERIEINALLQKHYVPSHDNYHDYDEILKKLSDYCGKSVYNYTEGETDSLSWDFYNSFYFAYTVVSTIGYGNLAPTNMLSRILMIFYGLIGIPMNGILLTQLGEFFGRVFVKAHEKYKSYKQGHSNDYYPRKLTSLETRKVGLAVQILVHLVPGFVMFIFFPAFLFSYYEGWNYDESVYYAFVTLTTIGFGDYVAGKDNSKDSGTFFILYKAFLICWISFGLGYTVMIMTFIARGMRSKKIIRIEHKLAVNLKHTQSKIWNELNKEMNYLRRVFNELQLSKVKRVYVDECNYHQVPLSKSPRSNSFPDLRVLLYGEKDKKDDICRQQSPRRRANSEVAPTDDQEIARVVSETDLQRIDKTATFATHAMVQPAELLARLVNILGYIPPVEDDLPGVSGDSSNQTTFVEHMHENNTQVRRRSKTDERKEKQQVSAEQESMNAQNSGGRGLWTIGQDKLPRLFKPRSRTASEVRLHETTRSAKYLLDRNTERTWSGPFSARKMQELMKTEMSNESSNKDRGGQLKESKLSKFRNFSLVRSVPRALISSGPYKNWFSTSSSGAKTSLESEREINNKDDNQRRRDSKNSVISNSNRHYYTHTGGGRGAGNLIETEGSTLLEETSVADFLRALTLLHASVASTTGSSSKWTDEDRLRGNQPRRKMGTASLTPPKLPSLFTLFSPPHPSSSNTNANTDQMTLTQQPISQSYPLDPRRNSLTFIKPTVMKSRRFSLRPVATPVSPPTPPRTATGSPFLSNSRRTSSLVGNITGGGGGSTFFESPKESLIRMEQRPGLSSPIKSSLNDSSRRFSLRPTPNQAGISSTGNANVTTAKALPPPPPRWKAGMLQRQIGQLNLRRSRARAFSLNDVESDDPKQKTEPFIVSSNIYKRRNFDPVRKNQEVSLQHQVSNDNGEPVSSVDWSVATTTVPSVIQPVSNKTLTRYVSNSRNTESSSQSLLEVKVEDPDVATNTVVQHVLSSKTTKPTDDGDEGVSSDNFQHLTGLTIEKQQSKS